MFSFKEIIRKIERDWDFAFPVMKFLKCIFKMFLFNFEFRFHFAFNSVFLKVDSDTYVGRSKMQSMRSNIDNSRQIFLQKCFNQNNPGRKNRVRRVFYILEFKKNRKQFEK